MKIQFVQRRTIWWPTLLGWFGLVVTFGALSGLWCFRGERFLALTERQPADVLVVEGWIGAGGVEAAKDEFDRGHYRFVVATSGLTGERWDNPRWSYAREAEELLLHLGVPREQVILAVPPDVESHRTFASAATVRQNLEARGIRPVGINVFTLGVHARRSRLVFSKVQRAEVNVGVIAWTPAGFYSEPWWRSSTRAIELVKESLGYAFELLLNSGRWSNAPDAKRS